MHSLDVCVRDHLLALTSFATIRSCSLPRGICHRQLYTDLTPFQVCACSRAACTVMVGVSMLSKPMLHCRPSMVPRIYGMVHAAAAAPDCTKGLCRLADPQLLHLQHNKRARAAVGMCACRAQRLLKSIEQGLQGLVSQHKVTPTEGLTRPGVLARAVVGALTVKPDCSPPQTKAAQAEGAQRRSKSRCACKHCSVPCVENGHSPEGCVVPHEKDSSASKGPECMKQPQVRSQVLQKALSATLSASKGRKCGLECIEWPQVHAPVRPCAL